MVIFSSRGRRRNGAALLSLLAILCAGCGTPLIKPADPGARVVVGTRDPLYVGLPEISDSALASLEASDWSQDRFQAELRKEIIFQFERKRVRITDDSAAAKAWLTVRLVDYESGEKYNYQGDARLRTAKGERQIEIRRVRKSGPSLKRSDPTVDYILQIAETVAAEARKGTAAVERQETPAHMWMFF